MLTARTGGVLVLENPRGRRLQRLRRLLRPERHLAVLPVPRATPLAQHGGHCGQKERMSTSILSFRLMCLHGGAANPEYQLELVVSRRYLVTLVSRRAEDGE